MLDAEALHELIDEFAQQAEEEKALKSKKRTVQNGHEGRSKRGTDKLDIEVANRIVRNKLVDFYTVYGKHTGVGQSEYLVHFLLQAMISFDLDHGRYWGKYTEK